MTTIDVTESCKCAAEGIVTLASGTAIHTGLKGCAEFSTGLTRNMYLCFLADVKKGRLCPFAFPPRPAYTVNNSETSQFLLR